MTNNEQDGVRHVTNDSQGCACEIRDRIKGAFPDRPQTTARWTTEQTAGDLEAPPVTERVVEAVEAPVGAVAAQETELSPRGKQPFEMTKAEFGSAFKPLRRFQRRSSEERANAAASTRMGHRQKEAVGEFFYEHPLIPNIAHESAAAAKTQARREVVAKAAKEGEPVPREVLADYRGESWADAALARLEGAEPAPERPEPPAVALEAPRYETLASLGIPNSWSAGQSDESNKEKR